MNLEVTWPGLPIAVTAAIILFGVKESMEFFRRFQSDRRKGRALRTLLARECESNFWTYKRLLETVKSIDDDFKSGASLTYKIRRHSSGDPIFSREFEDSRHSSWPLPAAKLNLMSNVLQDVAELDKQLFENLEAAYDSIKEMQHVRDSLLHFIETDDQDDRRHLEAFPGYAMSELSDIVMDLRKLYFVCTKKDLEKYRLR
ncbi:hypothetical protein IYX23_15235 [Methylocystis sp. L43]|jgi:hypothetical protein|uniref:hypothetical protein n=1 Tax=unclassified Methylocystis TaxID=2625913 RepID=UPI0018C1F879|nr:MULTISPECIES: hypothetical protein [unclassified Methylocystis]MBG0799022.1 hypothetical protein [Methylocystis sp. L43]MBG0806602.1 hypothetical protein [Methylocystis sp. H15]